MSVAGSNGVESDGRPMDEAGLLQACEAADKAGDPQRQFAAYQRYVAFAPSAGWAWLNLGAAALALDDAVVALECALRALATPDFPYVPLACGNQCNAYARMGRFEEAIASGVRAVELDPDYAIGWWALGEAYMQAGRPGEGLSAFREALHRGADMPPIKLLDIKRRLCEWDDEPGFAEALRRDLDERPERTTPWLFNTLLDRNGIEQRRHAEAFAQHAFGPGAPRPPRREQAGTPLRLGYVSGDFNEHATAYLLAETIERHDRDAFFVCGFGTGTLDTSAIGARIRTAFDAWHDLRGLSAAETAEVIRRVAIDVLIDLNGYTGRGNPRVYALRPAPTQINFLGHPGTMGAPFYDYIIADRMVAPDPAAFTEQVLWLDCLQPTCRTRTAAASPSRAELGLPEHAVVLGAMNNAWKLTPSLFNVWMQILQASPETVLWQLSDGINDRALHREAARHGLADRFFLAPRIDQAAHLARMAHIDLALDTHPCGGHTTTSDLLWSGAPVLTLLGRAFASRVAASLLHAAELPQLVVHDVDAYRAMAIELSLDRPRLAALRQHLLDHRERLPLFDNAHFVRQLEAAYRYAAAH